MNQITFILNLKKKKLEVSYAILSKVTVIFFNLSILPSEQEFNLNFAVKLFNKSYRNSKVLKTNDLRNYFRTSVKTMGMGERG